MKRFPHLIIKAWRKFTLKQRIIFIVSLALIIVGLSGIILNTINKVTTRVPASGGTLKVGLIGHLSSLNPILSQSNDCDRDLINLIYNGLYQIDGQTNLKPVLAEKTEISSDGKEYTVFLRDNIFWHDGIPFTADDVVFTIETIQNPEIKSPLFLNWQGVIVEKLSNQVVRFSLQNPYEPFLQNLTLKIIPKHIWENVPAENIFHNEYNIKPIGTGPYLFNNLQKDNSGEIGSYSLVANTNYFLSPPYLTKIIFNFYPDYPTAKEALLKKEIAGLSPLLASDYSFFSQKKDYQVKQLFLPRYYAVFFNLNNKLFSKDFRTALELAVDKKQLVKDVFQEQAFVLTGPLSPGFWGYQAFDPEYNPQKAQDIINQIKTSKSAPSEFKFTLFLPNTLELVEVAKFLVNSWQQIGVQVELQIMPLVDLETNVIQNRSYDALLFGEILSQDADLFSFWHSSQITDPGLNLAAYQNPKLDRLLEETRQIQNQGQRLKNFEEIQQILRDEKPALFLYNPYYLYLLPKQIQGITFQFANLPAERWLDITNWFIYTKRVLK